MDKCDACSQGFQEGETILDVRELIVKQGKFKSKNMHFFLHENCWDEIGHW